MKIIFILSTATIVWYMRKHKVVSQTYSKEEETFKVVFLLVPTFILALLVNHEFTAIEVRTAQPGPTTLPLLPRILSSVSRAGAVDVVDLSGGRRYSSAAGVTAGPPFTSLCNPFLAVSATPTTPATAHPIRTPVPTGDAAEFWERGQPHWELCLVPWVRIENMRRNLSLVTSLPVSPELPRAKLPPPRNRAYRALYLLNWIVRYFHEPGYRHWIGARRHPCEVQLCDNKLHRDRFGSCYSQHAV